MNKFDKIVFMDYSPLTESIYKNYYFKEILDLGIIVQYWDVSFVIKHHSELIPYHRGEESKKIQSSTHFNKEIKKNHSSTLYIPLMTYNGLVLSLFLIMSFHKCRVGVFGINTIPEPDYSPRRILNESQISFSLFKRAFLNKLSLLVKRIGLIRNIDYIFTSGTNGLNGFGRTTPKELEMATIININSKDYDFCLEQSQNSKNIIDGKYVVFLDEYLPLHPDFTILGLKKIDCDYYYFHLNKYFSMVEEKLGVPVVIAAHPKSVKYKEHDFFQGRKVLWYKTTELCKNAELVLAHDSTSINNAVFYYKPLLLLLFRKMADEDIFTYKSTLAFAKALKAKTVYIDDEECARFVFPTVDKDALDEYRYKYLTSPSTENVTSKELILNFLSDNYHC